MPGLGARADRPWRPARALALLLSCWLLCSCSPPVPAPAPVGSPELTASNRPAAEAQRTLDALAAAVRRQSRPAFSALISPRDPRFLPTATGMYDNLTALPLTALSFRLGNLARDLSPARRELLGPDAFVRQVAVRWRVSGDVAEAEHLLWLTFVPGTTTTVAGTIDGPGGRTAVPLWLSGPVTVLRGATVTVLTTSVASVRRWLLSAETAVAAVRVRVPAVRGDWNQRLVLQVPATRAAFERVLGVSPGSYRQIAAVAWPEGPDPAAAAVRIVLNPELAARLDAASLQVLLTHEVTHVATRSAASPAPTWLIEGYADYLAYEAHPRTADRAEAELVGSLRAEGVPRALPTDAQFTPSATDLRQRYAESWFACRVLARRSSPAALGRFYRAVDAGDSVDQALRSVLGLTEPEFTAAWSDQLRATLRDTSG